MLFYSFTDWKGSITKTNFVGFSNYIEIFTKDNYRNVFITAFYYLCAGLLQQIIALFLSILLQKKIKGSGFFKAVIFFPFIMNGVAVSLTFRMLYQVGGGLDQLLNSVGLGSLVRVWITNPKTVNFALAWIYLWKNVGYSFLIYLGTMQSVDNDYYDAAAIDGANT